MKRAGFTVAECICALLITSIVILTISFTMTSIRKINNRDLTSSIDWYLFLQKMESPNHHFELINAHGHTLLLYSQTMNSYYEIKGFDCLYLSRKDKGGYMPVLDNIKPFDYCFKRLDKQRVQIEVGRQNEKKMVGIITFYPQQSEPQKKRLCIGNDSNCFVSG